MILEYVHKKFEINRTKIKGGCQLVRKLVTHNSKSDLPLYSLCAESPPQMDGRHSIPRRHDPDVAPRIGAARLRRRAIVHAH